MKKEGLRRAAKRTGINYQTLYARMRRLGMSLEEAIAWEQTPRSERYGHHDGRPNVSAMARKVGIPMATLWWRMHHKGMTLEEAIAAGPSTPRRKHNPAKINDIAKKTGLTANGVRARMHSLGVSEEGAETLGAKITDRREKLIVLDFTHLRPRRSSK